MIKRRINLTVLIIGAAVFHICCREWISWYLLALAIAVPLFSALLSLAPMLTARAEMYSEKSLAHGGSEYVLCRCECGGRLGRIFGYPPRCVMRIKLEYLAADHSSEYEAALGAGQFERVRINTAHCTLVRITCTGAYALDMLGVLRVPIKKPAEMTCVIMPRARYSEENIEVTRREPRERPVNRYPEYSRELYELREYREGDLLRDVHWKMTAKTGKLIVREPEKTEAEKTAVTFDLCRSLSDNDGLMELVLGASCELLRSGREHSLCWLDENERLRTAEITGGEGQLGAFAAALGDRPPASGASIAAKEIADADVRLRILPLRTGEDNADE